ncbi:hypothetical protein SAMN04487910_2678 [Aquimarina amphilecti]|uniref:Uncharacterized protein n=1 Tax=Aquimarina amphilecti TaxID=1038014 RepID=A0A1H7QU29_AQUAM|nr:hypothetical protein SAMN04487910_2678 [Aquimarina amphilecti]
MGRDKRGLKNDFSKDPIDYRKIRKEDVHYPKVDFLKTNILRKFKVSATLILFALFFVF